MPERIDIAGGLVKPAGDAREGPANLARRVDTKMGELLVNQ